MNNTIKHLPNGDFEVEQQPAKQTFDHLVDGDWPIGAVTRRPAPAKKPVKRSAERAAEASWLEDMGL